MKALFISFLLLFIVSCSPFGFNPMGYEIRHDDLDSTWLHVSDQKYIPDSARNDYWKSPVEFFMDGGGDCEDFAIAMMYSLGPESEMLIIQSSDGIHAMVVYNEIAISPQSYGVTLAVSGLRVLKRISYTEAMAKATKHGTKGL